MHPPNNAASETKMETSLHHSLMSLDTGEMLSIESGRGRCLVVFAGRVWITQEGDIGDHIVETGHSFTFDRYGVALVEALVPTRLSLLGEPTEVAEAIGYEAAWLNTEPPSMGQIPAQPARASVDAVGLREIHQPA